MTEKVLIRPIETRDDAAMAAVIRAVMPEFGATGPGFAIVDPEVDALTAAYAPPGCGYRVVEVGGAVLGGAGWGPLRGGPEGVCELRKMYFLPEIRGRGWGRELLLEILDRAREDGYRRCYVETLGAMVAARRLYQAADFRPIPAPLGDTGHFGCDAWLLRNL